MEYTPHISDSFLHMLQVPSSTPPAEVVETMNPDLYLQNSLTKMSEFHYPVEDLPILKKFLEDWGLTCVYQTCIGILVKFESQLEKWKSDLNIVDIDKRTELAETSTLDISMNKANLEPPLKSFKLSQELNVDVILNSSTQGSLILDYYRQNNKLNDGIRSTLVDILIGQDTYFMKIGCNKNPKGKLYAKFYNSMRNLKNTGLVHTTTKLEKNKTGSGNQEKDGWTDREFVSENEIDYILDELKHNDSPFPDLEKNWKASVNYRLNYIKNSESTASILKTWKQYSIPYGHKLIDIDYHALFPNGDSIYQNFEEKSPKIFDLLMEKVKDINCRKILDKIQSSDNNISENSKNAALIYLLHAVFAPTSKKITKDENGKKNLIKYSIKDSQDSLIVFGESVEAMQHHFQSLRTQGNPIQPFIFIVGSLFAQREILVYFDTIIYKVHSIIRSVEVCYKIFHVFNLEYPTQSYIVWLFIQNIFFGLKSKFDKPHSKLAQVLSELK
ncbi:hypothetical protein ACI65C_006504 [Semiaphis heraclei]